MINKKNKLVLLWVFGAVILFLNCQASKPKEEKPKMKDYTQEVRKRMQQTILEESRLTRGLIKLAYESPQSGFKEFTKLILSLPANETERWLRCFVIRELPLLSTLDKSLEPKCIEIVKSIIISDADENARCEAIAALARLQTGYDVPLPGQPKQQSAEYMRIGWGPHPDDYILVEPRGHQSPNRIISNDGSIESYSYEHLLADEEIIILLLNKLVDDPSWKVREISALALKEGPDTEQIRQGLLDGAKKDENEDVRKVCIDALEEKSGINLPEEILAILKAAQSVGVRIYALGWIKHFLYHEESRPEIIGKVIYEMLPDEKYNSVKEYLIEVLSLYCVKEKNEEYLKSIRFCLDDADANVRKTAIIQLQEIGDKTIVPKLQSLAENDKDKYVRKVAQEAITVLSSIENESNKPKEPDKPFGNTQDKPKEETPK
jgi:hypothetical protein